MEVMDRDYWRRVIIKKSLKGQRLIDYQALFAMDFGWRDGGRQSLTKVRNEWLDERFAALPQHKQDKLEAHLTTMLGTG